MPRRSVGRAPRAWLADATTRDETPGGWDASPFGRAENLTWAEPADDPQEQGALLAAQNQHELAMQIRERIRLADLRTDVVAGQVNMHIDTLRGILAGTRHVTLTDLHRIAEVIQMDFRSRYEPRPADRKLA